MIITNQRCIWYIHISRNTEYIYMKDDNGLWVFRISCYNSVGVSRMSPQRDYFRTNPNSDVVCVCVFVCLCVCVWGVWGFHYTSYYVPSIDSDVSVWIKYIGGVVFGQSHLRGRRTLTVSTDYVSGCAQLWARTHENHSHEKFDIGQLDQGPPYNVDILRPPACTRYF